MSGNNTIPTDFELWTYKQPGSFFEVSDFGQRQMYDTYKSMQAEINRLKAENDKKRHLIEDCAYIFEKLEIIGGHSPAMANSINNLMNSCLRELIESQRDEIGKLKFEVNHLKQRRLCNGEV
jgi:hypothetical protein